MAWDPAEELAHLLQEAIAADPGDAPTLPGADEPPVVGADGAPLTGLTRITAELPAVRPSPSRRRRALSRRRTAGALQTASFFLAALAAVVVSMVCVFGGMVTYDPLRHLAKYRTTGDAVRWWPLLVYGPWMVASLSILRAALHQRRAAHSWAVVLLFSTVSILLCVSQAPRTVVDVSAAALPSLAALACFQQLVRQITLTRPPRPPSPRSGGFGAALRRLGPDTGVAPARARGPVLRTCSASYVVLDCRTERGAESGHAGGAVPFRGCFDLGEQGGGGVRHQRAPAQSAGGDVLVDDMPDQFALADCGLGAHLVHRRAFLRRRKAGRTARCLHEKRSRPKGRIGVGRRAENRTAEVYRYVALRRPR
ncbi:DUF2637 domain-containing protein [Streptomyces agglomeratus]|uniref:DUF2637 domain-containing protein n=1 Tax=Streptomyces agglomeratus TaxID=285458 RepID=UPI000A837F44